MKKLSNFCRRAFNLTELMIALVLAAVVIAAAVLYMSRFSHKAKLEIVKAELREKAQTALRKLETDLYAAIRVNGPNSEALPGVFRRSSTGGMAGPRVEGENDGIVIFAIRHKELSVPLRNLGITSSGDALQFQFQVSTLDAPEGTDVNDPSAVLAWNAQQYMNKAFQLYQYFLISNSSISLILPKVNSGQLTAGNRVGWLQLPAGHTLESKHFSEVPRLYTVSQVHYFVEDNKLYRGESWTEEIPTASNSEVILPNVTDFRIDYLFADRRPVELGVDPLVVPVEAISHPDDFPEEPRLSWSDISGIIGAVRVFSDKEVEMDDSNTDSSSFEVVGNRLYLNMKFASNPVAFESLLKDSQNFEYDTCHPSDAKNSRCNPSCENVFTDSDRESPRWEGYGRHLDTDNPLGPSDYCMCGQDPVSKEFKLPESSEGFDSVQKWSSNLSNPAKQRVYACIREFANCGNSWRAKDPRVFLACGCAFNTNQLLAYNAQGRLTWNPAGDVPQGPAWSNYYSVLESLDGGADPSGLPPAVSKLRCNYWQTCGVYAEWWLSGNSSGGNQTGGDPSGGYGTYCGCLTHVIDQNGNATSTPINEKNYDRLCNPNVCSDLFDDPSASAPVYKIYGQEYPPGSGSTPEQALSPDEAANCECRRQHGQVNNKWDFRIASNLPVVPNGSVPGVSGTVGSKTVDVHTPGGQVMEGMVCNQAQCSVEGTAIGCCAVANLSGSELAQWNDPTSVPPVIEEFRATHEGYCTHSCPGNANADLAQTRRGLFGVATNQELPSYCHNAMSSGSGPAYGAMQ